MRSDQNYFTVDGISANVRSYRYNGGGTPPVAGQVYQALSGSTPTQGAFGGLQGVISLDSLDEFTVQSSGYSAAYGRQPGAQVQLTSKSATFAYPWALDPVLAAPGGAYEGYYNLQRSNGQPPAEATTTATSTYAAQQDALTLIYKNLSLFAQDTFKVAPRLTLDLGVRWEYNPPLTSRGGDLIWATGWQTYSTMTLTPAGTPLYTTPFAELRPA